MDQFIEMIELLERLVSDNSPKAVAADLRIFSFDSHQAEWLMDQVCGQVFQVFWPFIHLNKHERNK